MTSLLEAAAGVMPAPVHRTLRHGDALVIIDLQNDYLPGGRMPVPHSDEVLGPLKQHVAAFCQHRLPVFVTRDWHPKNHCSFTTQGGASPVHCIQFTHGADFAPELCLPADAIIISKPGLANRDTLSAFDGSNFEQELRRRDITTLFIGGLCTDGCVLMTVLEALRLHFRVVLLGDALHASGSCRDKGRSAIDRMCECGAILLGRAAEADQTCCA